jgi:hypothetical protein
MNAHQQQSVVIKPRILPRDFIDVCVLLPVGVFQAVLLFGIPGLIAFVASRSLGHALVYSLLIALLASCIAYSFFLLFMVRRLTVTADGLRFHRVFGSPKFLSWERIRSVDVASRTELILRGWLWPLFPSREITPCLSALQHYRITWDKHFCYYPPACIEDFEQHVVRRVQAGK